MADPPWKSVGGYTYHVYARSVEELVLVEADDEPTWFVNTLNDLLRRQGCRRNGASSKDSTSIRLVSTAKSAHNAKYDQTVNKEIPMKLSTCKTDPASIYSV